ncbi:aldo/keto reductase [Streptomyces rhizosphaericus]|uniref:NADP-dependent oxidoreductase domain-containing protein n=1 Tax=Streptomyces rhizosphaericus TaxID=114699 RepID=A0ABP4CHU4_9ACTN|nr:aldo/keto reductase [Streptomyces indonesiensis]
MNAHPHTHTTSQASPGGVALPGIPVPLSRLVLGTMTFGDTVDRAGAAAMLDIALDAGVTGVDTANAYAGLRAALEGCLRRLGTDHVDLGRGGRCPRTTGSSPEPVSPQP